MKRVITLLTVGLICLWALGAQAATDPGALDPQGVEINVLICTQNQNDDLCHTYLQKFADTYGITVNFELAASTGYGDLLTLALAEENQGYDLVMVNCNHWGSLIDAGWIRPLDSFIEAEKQAATPWYQGIMTAALDACVLDGKRWSVAYSAGTGILMYNKTMFKEAGISQVPTTMEEVLECAALLNDPANGQYGIAFRGGQERGIAIPWLINWLYQGGQWYPQDGRSIAVLDTEEARVALEQLVCMYDYAPEGIDAYAYQEAMTAMQQGYAAMFVDAATLAVNLMDPQQTTLYDQFGFAALDGVYSWGDGWCFSIASNTAHAEWCWELIKCATSYETALDQILRGKAISCYRTDVYANEEIYSVLPRDLCDAVEKSASMAKIVYWPLISQSSEITSDMIQTFYSVIKGNLDVEQALSQLQSDIVDILEQDGVDF